ncbi:MAG: carboxypeptidase-like regulatory domain-containing protein [Candidatus Acidiferrales bacterium]
MADARRTEGYKLVNVKLTGPLSTDVRASASLRTGSFWPRAAVWAALGALFCSLPAPIQAQNPPDPPPVVASAPATAPASPQQQSEAEIPGTVTGTVLDSTGAAVAHARVMLARPDQSPNQQTLAGDDGQFSFANVPPGPFQITVTAEGFATIATPGVLHPGEYFVAPPIALAVATAITEVRVTPLSPVELAEEQIKDEEKQRVFGVIPNFYVTYVPDAVPLTPRQKFRLAWRSTIDPVTFALTGAVAGVQQANDDFKGYGQGAAGYGRRYGAAYGDVVSSTFIGAAILPSLLKQDPRYFYKGTGTTRERLLYAIANAVICKGDNGRWQPNYSGIIGGLAAGGISNLYYPPQNRNGAELTFENALIGIGESAAVNVIQEFIVPRFTPTWQKRQTAKN